MTKAHILGYPRIGPRRELKFALEAYWQNKITSHTLADTARQIRAENWQAQQKAGLDFVTVGDFSLYDHVLDTSCLLGIIPRRFRNHETGQGDDSLATAQLDNYFRMARGRSREGDRQETYACEMTKWFNTNYHYIVPEFDRDQCFSVSSTQLFEQVAEAQAAGYSAKPVLLGPLSYLWLGKTSSDFDRLHLIDQLLPIYGEIFSRMRALGVEWLQIDEPILSLDLPLEWRATFERAYNYLSGANPKLLLTTYFERLQDNLHLALHLPVAGIHIDCLNAAEQLPAVLDQLPAYKTLSLGVVDGRNVWRNNIDASLEIVQQAKQRIGPRLWVASSCSLLHCPLSLQYETSMDEDVKSWLAFAEQKLHEIKLLAVAVDQGVDFCENELAKNRAARESRHRSAKVFNPQVQQELDLILEGAENRHAAYSERVSIQREHLKLPLWPTTTIGSFPQTEEIRKARLQYKRGNIKASEYEAIMQTQIAYAVQQQEKIGLDVLVHGEAERNDMVEYFGEQLSGIAVSDNGWVQSYGSRCVKPPIIYGDVSRPQAISVKWTRYAQSLTNKPVKGMLTGPVTLLQWSFVRDDQTYAQTCKQLALALRDEVLELEAEGIKIIQVDEPALREGLPLRKNDWREYLDWAVYCFKLAVASVEDSTQIHTHMCYAEFNDIIGHIAELDADVITLETSRSRMELLEVFRQYDYPNEIGPGVYDIHSPRTPAVSEMVILLTKAAKSIPVHRLWVNPDCGLKTRSWPEVEIALNNMVHAAQQLREAHWT